MLRKKHCIKSNMTPLHIEDCFESAGNTISIRKVSKSTYRVLARSNRYWLSDIVSNIEVVEVEGGTEIQIENFLEFFVYLLFRYWPPIKFQPILEKEKMK